MNTSFSHALRVYVCASCGAANHASPEGGQVSCETCTEEILLASRRDPPEVSPPIDEQERIAALASQDQGPLAMPVDVSALTERGMLTGDSADKAMNEWQTARRTLRRGEGDEIETRLYFLTRLLYEHMLTQGDDMQLRGIIETALETSHSPRYRQVYRCMLACEAARVADLTGADDWLAPCDPLSSDIHSDSVYRYTAAYIATHKRQYAKVLHVLGSVDTPMAQSFDAICSVLRANALERQGLMDDAVAELSDAMLRVEGGIRGVERIVRNVASLRLCRRSFMPAKARAVELRKSGPSDRPSATSDRPSATSDRPPSSSDHPPSPSEPASIPRPPPLPISVPLLRAPREQQPKSQWMAVLPWLVLSLLFLILAGLTDNDATTSGGQRLDLFFLVMGGAFALPLILTALKARQNRS